MKDTLENLRGRLAELDIKASNLITSQGNTKSLSCALMNEHKLTCVDRQRGTVLKKIHKAEKEVESLKQMKFK